MLRVSRSSRRFVPWFVLVALCVGIGSSRATRAEESGGSVETLHLDDPDVSADLVAFAYADDLWLAPRTGGMAWRLTSAPGREWRPRFSPDGRYLAYSAEEGRQSDVFVIPVEGGRPRRLTWHPAPDLALGWTADGTHLVVASRRAGWPPDARPYLVRADGTGLPKPLPIPGVGHADVSPDGTMLAYTTIRDAFSSWKRYRGGRTPSIHVVDLAALDAPDSATVRVVPHENASDTMPAWCGDSLWFLSDRDGRMNLYRHVPGANDVTRVTNATRDDYDLGKLAAGPDRLVFTQGGALHLVDPANGSIERLRIRVPHDDLARRPRWQQVTGHVRYADLAPNGRRAVFEMRGEIITVPREHGAPRNLTHSPGAHDRYPTWSPDGERIAWFSDRSGEMRLLVGPADGSAEPTAYALEGAGYYVDARFSPDGKRILYGDKANALWLLDLETHEVTSVSRSLGSLGMWPPSASWSPDGAWIAHDEREPVSALRDIVLYEVATGKRTHITDGFADACEPRFSPDGAWLWFRASIEAGPQAFGLDMSASTVRDGVENLYVAVLAKDGAHPFAPRSDEGGPADAAKERPSRREGTGDEDKRSDDAQGGGAPPPEERSEEKSDEKSDEKGDAKGDEKAPAGKPRTKVDLDDIGQRIVAVPHEAGNYGNLRPVKDGLLFRSRLDRGRGDLMRFDLKKRKAETLQERVDEFEVSPDGKHLLMKQGSSWSLSGIDAKKKDRLDLDAVRVEVDPAEEWPQMLREVWRLQRDFFYDPALHGVDWDAAWDRWSALLPHVRTRDDLNRLIEDLIGELCCGHQYVSGGEGGEPPAGRATGLLGCEFRVEGERYAIHGILRGQNWNPDLRAPLTEPGVDVREGDLLLRVEGREVTAATNVYEAFADRANRPTRIAVAAPGETDKVREALVIPVESEGSLRQRAWIEANRAYVDRASGGRLAYVYMPNTGRAGIAAFDRDYYSQLDKEGLVLDARYNGGGKVADYVIGVLDRRVMSWWMNREGWASRSPFGTMTGPKAMLINEYAGSGGDWLPWMFRTRGLGPLVGTRTWGGLVGISGYPPLMDGGSVTAASFGVMNEAGEWIIENEGVAPDYEIPPGLDRAEPDGPLGRRDAQLAKAVELVLGSLKENGARPAPPAYVPPKPR